MDKRYQVFVSSTYTDLIEERRHVTQALLEMDCIPAGMEMFPAIDEDQFEFIKTVIDDCDYYLLIIGGRYGSLAPDGVSYTEKEYDYAVSKEIPVIALLHGSPAMIESGKSEQSEEGRAKLTEFRKKAQGGRLSKEWKTPEELAGLVSRSLHISFNRYPRVGWIRADRAASEDLLNEVNTLRKENSKLRKQLAENDASPPTRDDLASLDEQFVLHGTTHYYDNSRRRTIYRSWEREISWRVLFERLSPYLTDYKTDSKVKDLIEANVMYEDSTAILNDQDFQTVKVQFEALKLVKIEKLKSTGGDWHIYWSLSPSGKALMLDLRLVKKGEKEKVVNVEVS